MTLRLRACTAKAASRWVALLHRHFPDVGQGRFAVAVVDETGAIRGVAIAGNGPRVWEGTGRLSIARVATDGAENACSMLLGALCRAGKALGYLEAWTYTLPEEPGTSLRAAGFIEQGLTQSHGGGGEHSRTGRPRKPAKDSRPKRRWKRSLGGAP